VKAFVAASAVLLLAAVAPAEDARVRWAADLDKVKIPNKPVSGEIHGKAFKIVFAHIPRDGKIVRLGQGKTAPEETIDINFWQQIESPEGLEGKKFEWGPRTEKAKAPGIIVTYFEPRDKEPKMQILIPGEFVLRVEFGKKKDKAIPGKIYFATTKDRTTYVAGTFRLKID
jgi:hypothetical protein